MRWTNMYLAATGVDLPGSVAIADEIAAGRYSRDEAERTGMIEYAHGTPGVSSLEYAAHAARAALAATPENIRTRLRALYHTFSGAPGGPTPWNPVSKLHEMLRLDSDVIPQGMTNGCANGLQAVQMACLTLNGHPSGQPGAVVVVGSEAWPPELVDPRSAPGLVFASGAGAVVVSNIDGFASILATSSRIDSRLADLTRGDQPLAFGHSVRVDLGARAAYFHSHSIDRATTRQFRDELVLAVVHQILVDAMVELGQIKAFVLTHSGELNLRNGYFRLIPIAERNTNTAAIGKRIGHVGTADWFIGLHQLRAAGKLQKGDLVLLIGGGGGWLEAAVLLEMR